ncbi:DUF2510 domain-containing protein [Mycobacterium scrofulaceum]|uniref:DUF2510 domain-containing protein n=1 Tax=Mycobacterium scrofulaceum TaxID=1783 RepID=A0A1X0KET6_MYCSC|nr:DUF2510 domain-containing protein [Mycobacterium scrofulaceum]ORB73070.1 hypothetical protein BST44_15945 [Mycobacterium scrofulaceum]
MTDPYRRFQLSLTEHTGAVIFWQQRSYTFTGTLEQCERAYRTAQAHNLGAGWWSVVSLLVMNWVALISNWGAIRGVRKLAEQPPGGQIPAPPAGHAAAPGTGYVPAPPAAPTPPPGWYGDPSGPGHRYWDGVRWTPWTNPPGFPPQGR